MDGPLQPAHTTGLRPEKELASGEHSLDLARSFIDADRGRPDECDHAAVEPPERRIVEGEMYGFPVPGSWPGGKPSADEEKVEPEPGTKKRRRWRDRFRRQKPTGK